MSYDFHALKNTTTTNKETQQLSSNLLFTLAIPLSYSKENFLTYKLTQVSTEHINVLGVFSVLWLQQYIITGKIFAFMGLIVSKQLTKRNKETNKRISR